MTAAPDRAITYLAQEYGRAYFNLEDDDVMTVNDIEAELAEFLNLHPEKLPFGTEVEAVQIMAGRQRKTARKRRPTADRSSDKGDSVFIVLRPGKPGAGPRATVLPAPVGATAAAAGLDEQVSDLLRSLRNAEQMPGHSFVALKWFRDAFLPREGHAWAGTPEQRERALDEAIRRGWIRVEKIPNPRNPGFATSTLRAETSHPEVQRTLGQKPTLGWDFTPIAVKGEPMSETVRRMRDEGC